MILLLLGNIQTRCIAHFYLRAAICEDLKLLRCLIRPSLRHEKHRSFLFSRVDLLNRTDPGEAVRNVEYMLAVLVITKREDIACPHGRRVARDITVSYIK